MKDKERQREGGKERERVKKKKKKAAGISFLLELYSNVFTYGSKSSVHPLPPLLKQDLYHSMRL